LGDDDQNIYEFRGSDSDYMFQLAQRPKARFIEMTDNFRSARHPVTFANEFVRSISKRMKHTPIKSMRSEEGWVSVTHHTSDIMYEPLVDELRCHRHAGTSCILTQTNEEAVILTGLLRKEGVPCKLIQSMDGFRFWNLSEIRYFLRYLDKRVTTPVISGELWEEARRATSNTYGRSQNLELVKRCFEEFEHLTRRNTSAISRSSSSNHQWRISAMFRAPRWWYRPSTRPKGASSTMSTCF